MSDSSPNMTEIARKLGLSRRTVSTVINDKTRERRISEATARRVREYLDAIGYVPSRSACNLRTGSRTAALGMLFGGHFYNHLTRAFDDLTARFCRPPHAELIIAPTAHNEASLRELVARGCQDLLWLHADREDAELRDPPRLLPLLRRFRRVVVYNYRFGFGARPERLIKAGCHLVGVDRVAGIRQLGALLHEHGHRRVALYFPGSDPVLVPALNELGLEVRCLNVPPMPASRETQGRHVGTRLAELRREGVTAAICNAEEVAAHALPVLAAESIKVPADLSLVAWSGSRWADVLGVPLTTADVPVDALVERTAELLTGDADPASNCLAPVLRPRASHGPAPAA